MAQDGLADFSRHGRPGRARPGGPNAPGLAPRGQGVEAGGRTEDRALGLSAHEMFRRGKGVNPFPTPLYCGTVGSAALYRSPLGVPGTDLRVWDDWCGHKEDICGRSFNELTVIHTR